MQIRKKGDEIKKNSSPLKLLSQSQPNFSEMILEWSRPFEEISIFSNGGHLGYRTALSDTILKGDHPRKNCVRQHPLVSKMAAIIKNRNFFKWPKTALF
jgi:hypothetical protein